MTNNTLDIEAAQFTQAELCELGRIENTTANNWVRAGFLSPQPSTDRRLRGRRLFSFMDAAKARAMQSCIEMVGIPAGIASTAVDKALHHFARRRIGFAAPEGIIGEYHEFALFQSNGANTSYFSMAYRKSSDHTFYSQNPLSYPKALPLILPQDAFVILPLTTLLSGVFADALDVLNQVSE